MEQLIQNHPSVIRAILVTFIFQGAYIAMGVYMLLVYMLARKKDYLLYGIYLLLFSVYFFVRVDLAFDTDLMVSDPDMAYYFTTPLLFLITGVYIDFINTFAEIEKHHQQFSREVSIFSKVMYTMTVLTMGYLLITHDSTSIGAFLKPAFTAVHIYAVYSVIRAFIVIKSKLRYYVLTSNLFLIIFTAIGLNASVGVQFREGIYSNTFWGFYSVNASQLGVFLEMICFALGLGYKFNQVEVEKDKIQKLDTLKTQLYTNISHEIRTPLTLISGPIDSQLAKSGLTPEDRRELELIKTNSDRLLELVNQMLDLSVTDSGRRMLRITRGNMALIWKQQVGAFQYQADARNIRIEAAISGLEKVWFDRDVIEKIGANLFSNAVKYADDHSIIEVDARQADGHVVLSVSNIARQTGADDLNQLFLRYYQENEAAPGVGIGLALVKNLVELVKGHIDVRRSKGNHICFTVTLPVEQEAFETNEYARIDPPSEITETEDLLIHKKKQATVLIVEDNDDIREFTASLFRQDYHILTAADGRDGLHQALEALPDVVITDIMMPGMSGIELCRLLKNNNMTSHIPVMMLTARIGEVHELEGYETGADTYLTKPFHSGMLQLKIRNLLADRDRFRQRYKESFSIDPELALAPAECDFLTKLKTVCETHIADPELTAENLASLMLMSRAQLHRKLNAIFGLSATAFIRTQRIKLACELLIKEKITVSEIAYKVGFNTVSYFNKCFKSQMDCTPNEYLRKKIRPASDI